MRFVLILLSGETQTIYPIVDMSTTIGRAPNNTIQFASTNVSRHHAVIERGPNACEIVDLDSTNGTYVNDQRIAKHATNVLEDGVLLRIGDVELRFETEDSPDDNSATAHLHELSARTIQATVLKGETTIVPVFEDDATESINPLDAASRATESESEGAPLPPDEDAELPPPDA